jgi:hypothetical protein
VAIMRCEDHPPKKGKIRQSVQPVGYPDTAVVCGSKTCVAPALIWLDANEKAAYIRGDRVFEAFAGSMMKVRAI